MYPSSTPRRLVALVDASNFYVSCERVFRPDLRTTPVVVLSNNDGCIVSRSDEVKAFGTPMAAPYFKLRKALEARGTVAFSSNYELYADFHRRVIETLSTFTPDIEPYSIDEAFLTLSTPTAALRDPARLAEIARAIRARVLAWTKIPVRVSIAATKTLAKVGSGYTKALLRRGEAPAACLHGWAPERLDALLEATPVGDVWGVGRRHRARLLAAGVDTARALRDRPDAWVRQRMHTPGLRTVFELRGTPCIPLGRGPRPRRTVGRSRSFSRPVTAFDDVRQALAVHAEAACETLRREGLAARAVQAFFHTGHAEARGPHRSAARAAALSPATNDTAAVVAATHRLLAEAWDASRAYPYRKAGVLLLDVMPAGAAPADLFAPARPERARLLDAIDRLNVRFASSAARPPVYVASAGPGHGADTETGHDWAMRQRALSPFYSTRAADVPRARADGLALRGL